MSGTRSPSPRAPATEALIVAHGQPSEPEPAEAGIAALARRVQAVWPGGRVRGATLAMPGSLDTALAKAAHPPLVYPLFMSDGWFTASELSRRIAGRAAAILPPLGLDPALPGLAAGEVARSCAERGWRAEATVLIVAAHGSGRSLNAARAARRFADGIGSALRLGGIRVGFVEEPPGIAEAARDAGPRAICLPFFAAGGEHVAEDVPAALDDAGFRGLRAPPIGSHPAIPALIAQRLGQRAGTDTPGPERYAPASACASGWAGSFSPSMTSK